MGLVTSSHSKSKIDPLLDLSNRKQIIREQLRKKELLISSSTKHLISPFSLINSVLDLYSNKTIILQGFMLGMKFIRFVKRIFQSKQQKNG